TIASPTFQPSVEMFLRFCRCVDSVAAVVALICLTVLLSKICLCNSEENDEVLGKNQLTEFYRKGLFVLESVTLKRCVTVDRSSVVLEDCEYKHYHNCMCCEHFWESNHELRACYQFNLYTLLTWSQALSTCQAQGGNLLSITSLAEHRYIRDRLANVGAMVWIGLNHLKNGYGWKWSDGAPLSLVNFTTDKNEDDDRRDCAAYSDLTNTLMPRPCDTKHEWICKLSRESQAWVFYRGAEYLLANQPYNWHAVSLACQMMGAHLLSIHSREELQFIKERLRRVCHCLCS
ncbi:hypothetical protein XENOCAPTIV_024448, partial [Xenoophorus captivus]